MDHCHNVASSPAAGLATCRVPTPWGEFRLHGLADAATGAEHAALVLGRVDDGAPVLARIHSECLTGDVFSSLRCDCGAQFRDAMQAIGAEGRGVLVYLRQEGRGVGLINKIRAYALQEGGADTVDANRLLGLPDDDRDYAVAASILAALGVRAVRLMTNNPSKIRALRCLGVEVVERIALHSGKHPHNERYRRAKVQRMGHLAETDLPAECGSSPNTGSTTAPA